MFTPYTWSVPDMTGFAPGPYSENAEARTIPRSRDPWDNR